MQTVRKSTYADLPRLMDIYRQGREIMLSCGDVNQWKPGHPSEDIIREDIDLDRHYCVEEDGEVVGAFALTYGADPTYGTVYGGSWVDDTHPYATIHRLASTKDSHGVAGTCFDWCWDRIHNLRVDTHEDNVIMLHCIAKAGFTRCGIIHLLNGDPRIAFQKINL